MTTHFARWTFIQLFCCSQPNSQSSLIQAQSVRPAHATLTLRARTGTRQQGKKYATKNLRSKVKSLSEVGPLFPEMRSAFQMLIIWKTRDSLMDVDFVSAARLVSLASHSRVPYLPARYNAEHSPTKNIGQILRILGMAK